MSARSRQHFEAVADREQSVKRQKIAEQLSDTQQQRGDLLPPALDSLLQWLGLFKNHKTFLKRL